MSTNGKGKDELVKSFKGNHTVIMKTITKIDPILSSRTDLVCKSRSFITHYLIRLKRLSESEFEQITDSESGNLFWLIDVSKQ